MEIRTLTASSEDSLILNAILNDPRVRSGVGEDGTPDIEYSINHFPVTFLITVNDRAVGLILFRQNSLYDIDAHICFIETGHAVRAAKKCIEMLDEYYDWRVISCKYPATATGVNRLVKHVGFEMAGTIPKCYKTGGKFVDMNIYFYRRMLCLQQ